MIIKYLKKLKDHTFDGERVVGLPLNKIEDLEAEFNNSSPFPTAFREFLFLGGEDAKVYLDILDFEEMQQLAEKQLKKYGQTIDRPFFVVDQLDGCNQFSFIYLDEQEEDPDVYFCNVAEVYYKYTSELIQKSRPGKLSEYLDHHIGEAEAMEEG